MASPSPAPVLAGWYVISLRPSGAHGPVRRAAAALGARVLPISTLRLLSMDAGVALDAALACPILVFTSPAAVRFARAQRPLVARRGQTWLAVGSGTATALRQAGIPEVRMPPDRADSEGLLALPELQSLGAQSVGLVTAPGGRGLIGETLAQRGARVHLAEVYRREPLIPRPSRTGLIAALPDTAALLVSSAEAFDALWSRLDDTSRATLRRRPGVASSPRLAARLAEEAFAAIVIADGAAPNALLAALAADVAGGRFR
ncbi:MAG TPA: uroporphyrinogen-III synthase [Arenimonas sp.]|uniref:uroporphyrinogen-III synthase n=1 Tax=Arenimonas sp. TaxID=1872635 RepID=UPI002D7F0EFD|nr:uroporphyrinogen-III synthase [Arenimonas sp.]HEU0154184.1 uroporphyrinogen-III synthase [Arenimonas sp.]